VTLDQYGIAQRKLQSITAELEEIRGNYEAVCSLSSQHISISSCEQPTNLPKFPFIYLILSRKTDTFLPVSKHYTIEGSSQLHTQAYLSPGKELLIPIRQQAV
jgi:hypothetical protein